MAPSSVPPNPTAHNVAQLLPRFADDDPDFRFMALSDLHDILQVAHPGLLLHDDVVSAKTVEGLLTTLVDTNGEVQNQALKCLGPFVNRINDKTLPVMIDKLSTLPTGNTVDQSIPAMALREVVISLPRPTTGAARSKSVLDAYSAISRVLIPRLIGYNVIPPAQQGLTQPPKGMLQDDLEKGSDSNALDVLIEVGRCFGSMLQDVEIQALQQITFAILENDRASSMMKKKSVTAVSVLAGYFSDQLLSNFLSKLIELLRDPHITRSKRKLYITILGSMARSIPRKFGPYLKTLAPFVLSALSTQEQDEEMDVSDDEGERDPEIDEVLEAALIALDGFLASCSQDMRMYTDEAIEAATRYLKYDPNLAQDDDEDDDDMPSDEEDALEGEDFEEETGYDDDEDASWKVRRCAAKVLYTLISTRSNGDLLEDGTLYERVAPALITRFREREDNVRLEVMATLSNLIKKSGDGPSPVKFSDEIPQSGMMLPPPSKKRRRGGSDASMFDLQASSSLSMGYASPAPASTPPVGPRASLAKLSPDIVKGIAQLLKQSSCPPTTKQACISLIKDIVITQRGGLDGYLNQLISPVVEAAKVAGGTTSSASATANSLRTQALQLIGAIADTHPSKSIQPYVASIIDALLLGVKDKYSKLSIEALAATEQVIKALTPPRAATSGTENQQHLEQLFDALFNRISANDADVEVRRSAIHVLGLLLGRSSGEQGLLSSQKRTSGLELLADRLKNELTRLASVRAVDSVAAHTKAQNELSAEWVQNVALELAAQLRKASRVLRGASLSALRTLALNSLSRSQLDSQTKAQVVEMLLPLLNASDLHLLGPALIILATFVKDDAQTTMTSNLNGALCQVAQGSISGTPLDALLKLVRIIGEQRAGQALMQALLQQVGVSGHPEVVGKVIGNLLVYGGDSVGVKLEQFITELETAQDDKRKCLALVVLGESALRLGAQSTVDPKLFIKYFSTKSENVPLAAAVALGRAGAGSVSKYLPVILSTMGQPSSPQYLFLHSIKEILQHDDTESEIIPYASTLWQNLVVASQLEDNKAIGAECIGRLTIIDPKTHLPQLQAFLNDRKGSLRAMVISALRYTFTDTDEAYDEYLKPIVVPMLVQMLNEPDLENRRLALMTFNSAMHNKPDIILPALDQLLPLAMKETVIKPELIREVQMGPFKLKVDDGLEIRKSAYETLYALLEKAFARLSPIEVSDFFDRIVAGITDEHDIRILCNLMLTKLMVIAPDQVRSRLDSLAENFRIVLAVKPKENAVKQEIEKIHEGAKGVLKVSIQINKQMGAEAGVGQDDSQLRVWAQYWDQVQKEHEKGLKAVAEELKERDR
ncbi:Cullin-associated NEDD8-dissociated protein 1, C-terminal part [Alternaria arborescens]|uniref:Cullin-associated NEDD8-dissociated protein 1, C-terminal part n=1 Tax=Alternaria arborescens TaxID=156630 RepID=UPI001074F244|nr:Cullin-associated NEDD8-dissociated protein 1, C-terminal part [Alternaria arborescens]RYO36301.1 Cullin-associated NEDD8-dissociated protein 1, C-terminal part [Alternaria arborescens]